MLGRELPVVVAVPLLSVPLLDASVLLLSLLESVVVAEESERDGRAVSEVDVAAETLIASREMASAAPVVVDIRMMGGYCVEAESLSW